MQKRAILILGMHRSGTSVLTRILNLLGVRLSAALSKSNEFNEKGYWESEEVQEINDRLLVKSNSAWFDPYSWSQDKLSTDETEIFIREIVEFLKRDFDAENSLTFGIKDPRICRFAPLWKTALSRFGASVFVVIPFRNPLAVAASLGHRDGLRREVALLLWLRHVLDAEFYSRDCDRSFISYENLIDNWSTELSKIMANRSLDLPAQTPEVIQAVEGFLSESSQHHKFSIADLRKVEGVSSLVFRAYQLLQSAAQHDDRKTKQKFDVLREEFAAYEQDCGLVIDDHIQKFLAPKTRQISDPEKIRQVRAERFVLRESLFAHVGHEKRLESNLKSKEAKVTQLKQNVKEKAEELVQVRADISSLKELNVTHQKSIDKLNADLKIEKAAIVQSEEERNTLVSIHENSIADLSEYIDRIKSENLAVENQSWSFRKALATSIEEKLELQKSGQDLEQQLADKSIKILTLQHELNMVCADHNSMKVLAKRLADRCRQLVRYKIFGWSIRRKVLESGAFDENWYLKHYRDLKGIENPLLHYLLYGANEQRSPGPYFDSGWYLKTNRDVAQSGINPLVHYLERGWKEDRDPNPFFSTKWYLDTNPGIRKQALNPLVHFISSGDKKGLAPSPLFDSQWYLTKYQDVNRAKMPPFYHFINFGQKEGRLSIGSKEIRETKPVNIDGIDVKYFPGKNVFRRKAACELVCNLRPNVLLVTHTAGSRLFGAERSFFDVCSSLDPAKFNVFAVVPTENKDYINALSNVTDGVYKFAYRWWRKGFNENPSATKVFATLLQKHSIDLLYGNTIMLREPFLAAEEQKIPSVLHAREIIEKDEYLREAIGLETDQILEHVKVRADFFIANSKATALSLNDANRVRLLYNTINGKDFQNLENSLDPEIYVGIISSNIPKKGLSDFVQLAHLAKKELPQVVFRVIGPDTEHTKQLQETIEREKSDVNLEFCGYIDASKKAIEKVNIVVNFSHFAESFGRTIAEAMMAGKPVIVYDHGALPELVEHTKTGYVIPFQRYEAAIPYLKELVSQPELIKKLGDAGRIRAKKLFDLPVFRSKLQEIISDFLITGEQNRLTQKSINRPGKHRMKIAYFLWHFPVPSETFVLNELRYLVEQGHDVLVFCRQSPHKDFVLDFEITWQQVATPEELAECLIRTKRTRVHSHFVYPTVTEFLWPACEKANIEFTFIAHAQDIFRYENDKKNRIGEVAQSRLCKRVLVPGRFHRDYLLSRGVPDNKIFINPQGIDPHLYAFHGDEFKVETRNICCVQRFVEKKGILHLIQAAPTLAKYGINIDVYGYGPLEESYRREIKALGVDNVKLCGAIKTRSELIEAIATSDLFVTPCIRAADGDMDGIPTVFMEAMSLGTPVVTTGISSIPDLIADGVSGLICKEKNPRSVAETICRYYDMPESRKLAIRQAAHKVVATQFNTEILLGRLIDVYQQRTIDIVIVAWNNLPELKEVIARVLKFTGMSFHLIITDNNSEEPVVDFLQQLQAKHEQVKVLWQEENLFVGPGTNEALKEGNSEYAIYICGKEGFALRHNWERELVEYMDAHAEVGLAGTLGYSPTYLTGSTYNSIFVFPDFRNTEFALNNPERVFRHVQGGLFVVRREMYDAIGGFSEKVPHYYTDVEYSFYVESCGWKLGQIPGVLALYNKSRPGIYSRLTEDVRAIHPPLLEEAAKVGKIANGEGALCCLCEWYGERFVEQGDQLACPDCGSLPAHRSLWRFLAESTLTYRRLLGLYINPEAPLADLWEKQFQGSMLNKAQLSDIRSTKGVLDFSSNRLDVIYLDDTLALADDWLPEETHRVLSKGGTLLVRQPFGQGVRGDFQHISDVKEYLENYGFCNIRESSYTSKVVQYDWIPLLTCEK